LTQIRASGMLRFLFFACCPPPPRSTLFPYTTLFRSLRARDERCRQRPREGDTDRPLDGLRVGNVRQRRLADDARRQLREATLSRSEEHTSELQSLAYLVCRLLLEKKKTNQYR